MNQIDTEEKISNAEKYLENYPLTNNSSIVFDIDDTLISYESGELIGPVYHLYLFCLSMGIKVFIVTNRAGTQENIDYTENQLKSKGLGSYERLYLRRPGCSDMWSPKIGSRKDIISRGYDIVMSVGDMPWDVGVHGGYPVLLD